MVFSELENQRTQDLPTIFSDAGLFYVGKAATWLKRKAVFSKESRFVEIGRYESIDIDTESDWLFAEELFRIREKMNSQPK